MKANRDFAQISPNETVDRAFDFCDGQLTDSETLASAVFSLAVAETEADATADATPAARLSGTASIDSSEISGRDTVASQRLAGCIAGNRYLLTCLATTSRGQLVELFAHFWCRGAA